MLFPKGVDFDCPGQLKPNPFGNQIETLFRAQSTKCFSVNVFPSIPIGAITRPNQTLSAGAQAVSQPTISAMSSALRKIINLTGSYDTQCISYRESSVVHARFTYAGILAPSHACGSAGSAGLHQPGWEQ